MDQRNEKGITLIALVITIIVLLILAGVTISMVLGDEGIITNAQTAKAKNEEKTAEAILELAALTYKTNELSGEGNGEITSIEGAIENALEEQYDEEDYEFTTYEATKFYGEFLILTIKGENFYIDEENKKVTKTITFNIGDTTYTAEAGMTWEEWVNSSYSLGDYKCNTYDKITLIDEVLEEGFDVWVGLGWDFSSENENVYKDDIIVPNCKYRTLSEDHM